MTGKGKMTQSGQKKLTGIGFLFLTLVWIGFSSGNLQAQFQLSISGKKEKNKNSDLLKRHLEELKNVLKTIPRENFDLKAAVKSIGRDPEKIFLWVRDFTYLVPYRGALRGASGMLMDRSGNSLDRAFLLKELLRVSGVKARLAQGILTDSEAEAVLSNAVFLPGENLKKKELPSLEKLRQQARDFAGRLGLVSTEMEKQITDSLKDLERRDIDLSRRIMEQTENIFNAVKNHKADGENLIRSASIEALKEHWWVQWQKDGEWIDLDPTFPNALPGRAAGKFVKSFNSPGSRQKHTLILRVLAEKWEKGQLSEEKILEHKLRPADNMNKRIFLTHEVLNMPLLSEMAGSKNPVEHLRKSVADQTEWIPVLKIGSRKIKRAGILENGRRDPTPGKKKKKASGNPPGQMLSAFGGNKTVEETEGVLSAVWVEYEIQSPGRPSRIIRRAIFDLIGPASRGFGQINKPDLTGTASLKRSLLMMSKIEILPVVCRPSAEFLQVLSLEQLLKRKNLLLKLAEKGEKTPTDVVLEALEALSTQAAPLQNMLLSRLRLDPYIRETFLDTINLYTVQTFLSAKDNGELFESQLVDIIFNEMGVFPIPGLDAFRVRIGQGVLDTNVETEALPAEGTPANTAILYDESKSRNLDWVLIKSETDPVWDAVRISADLRARIEKDLSQGFLALVPKESLQINGEFQTGWWRIHPQTGSTLGMGENGKGQATTSYAVKTNTVLQLKASIQFFADIMKCIATAITSPLRGERPQTDSQTLECVWTIACGSINKLAGKLVKDVNWTNIIINETVSQAWKGLCSGIWSKLSGN